MGRQNGRNQQQAIADMMAYDPTLNESPTMGGNMMGSMADPEMGEMDSESAMVIGIAGPVCSNGNDGDDETDGFTTQQLKIAKKFIELMGGADRAREAVDKVDDCMECLDIIDDEPVVDEVQGIEAMAGMMPDSPDLPMGLANLYNPSAGNRSMQ